MAIKKRGNREEKNMKEAVDHVLIGRFIMREAALRFSVPKSTLADRVQVLKGEM